MRNIVLISFSGVKPTQSPQSEMVNLLNSRNKKAPAQGRGFPRSLDRERSISGLCSVLREDRAAELVVQADEAHVDVLLDVVGLEAGEGDILAGQEDVVVLDANRP